MGLKGLFMGILGLGLALSEYIPVPGQPPPTFIVDLDADSAEGRWGESCEKMKENIMYVAENIMASLGPKEVQTEFVNAAMNYYDHFMPPFPWKEDIDYFAKCTGLTIEEAVTVNLFYDLTAFCTSIVAEQPDGTILHGRNQDFPGYFRNDTVVLKFMKDGKLLIQAVSFLGYVGIPTGMNSFMSISIDARYPVSLPTNIQSIKKGYFPSGWLVREVLTNSTSWNDAVITLRDTKIQAPIYYITGGVNNQQGAVLTRDSDYNQNMWFLNESKYDWFLVETNYPNWLPPPPDDDRRNPAIDAMNAVGQANIDADTLYGVLSTPPVLNEGTLYTAIFGAPGWTEGWNATIREYTGNPTGVILPFMRKDFLETKKGHP